MPECFLQKTMVRLADGNEYAFRKLPFTRQTARMVGVLENPNSTTADELETMIAMVEKSLSYDQDAETIERLFDSGLIPIERGSEILKQIVAAMGVGAG